MKLGLVNLYPYAYDDNINIWVDIIIICFAEYII